MKVRFWGTRGSLPASLTASQVREKVRAALERAAETPEVLADAAARERFLESLPFAVRGTYGTNTACVEIQVAGGGAVLLGDAGSGLRDYAHHWLSLPEETRPREFHIFVTHLHWDHVIGLPFFTPAYLPGHRIHVHGFHPEIPDVVRGQFGLPTFPVPFDALAADWTFDIAEPGTSFRVGDTLVRSIRQNHPGGSWGYRFEHGGRACVYSTDSEHKADAYEPDYRFLPFFADADLLVFDAQYSLAEATFGKADWGHSSNIMGVELAARSRVRHLCLFHHEPTTPDADLDEFLRSTRLYAGVYHRDRAERGEVFPREISLAHDGLVVDLG